MPDVRLTAQVLGGFDLRVDGRPVASTAFERPSGLRLLKLLLATSTHRVRREEAAELLWPENDPDRSAANLRKAVHFARRALAAAAPAAETIIEGDGDALRLDATAIHVDADDLRGAIDAIELAAPGLDPTPALDTLAGLGGRDLLPSDPYDEWLVPIRERLRHGSIEALIRGAVLARARGDRARGFALVERSLALEPADERAHRIAIEMHLDGGELHAARRQLQACRQAVAEAYGVEPDPVLEGLIAAYAAGRVGAAAAPAEQPIVGRRRELAEAEAALDLAAAGHSSGVVLRGPAGIGKSRILRELAGSIRASGATVVELRGLEEAAAVPFAAVAGAIVEAFGGAIPATLAEPGRSALASTAPGSGAVGSPMIEFASEAALSRALLAAIAATPGSGTIALLADDAQWLDGPTINLIATALAGTGETTRPVLVVATIRTETATSTPVAALLDAVEAADGQVVAVGPLGPREVRTVVERELGGERLDDALAAMITDQAAGAPLFAVEVYRSARDAGLLERRDGTWGLRRGVASLPVPSGVARLVERRVGRLDAATQVVLATAAELGNEVSFEELVATGVAGDATLDAVDAAINLGIIGPAGNGYAFNHPLYRAALRASLPPRARADVHHRVMSTLSGGINPLDDDAVRRAGVGTVDLAATASHAFLAVELGRSDLAVVAVAFGLAAGERQANLFDRPGAIATLQRALRLWHRLPADARSGLRVTHGYVHLGQALRRAGDDSAAFDAFRSAIATSRNDRERASAYTALAWLPYEHGRFDEAIDIAREGLEQIAEPQAVATLETMLGWVTCRADRWSDGRVILQRAVDVLDEGGPTPALMRALDRLGVAVSGPEPATAVELFERGRWMAIELAQTVEQATIEMHLGALLGELGRFDEALAALERGRALCAISGEQYIAAVIEWNAAQVAQQMGRLEEAIEHRRRELEIFQEIGPNARHQAMAHAHIAHLARLLADATTEQRETDLARATARSSGHAGLIARVEWALQTEDWFANQPEDGNAPGTA